MRLFFAAAALLLPLAGCVVPPPAGPYPQPGYPGAYAPQDFAYPGYAYNNGSPTYYDGGVAWPLIFYGGGWGYWDGYHRWHGAPGPVANWLATRHPGGVGYRPYGGGQWGQPGNWNGRAYGPPAGGYRPGVASPGVRPIGGGAARPAQAPARQAAPRREHEEHH